MQLTKGFIFTFNDLSSWTYIGGRNQKHFLIADGATHLNRTSPIMTRIHQLDPYVYKSHTIYSINLILTYHRKITRLSRRRLTMGRLQLREQTIHS